MTEVFNWMMRPEVMSSCIIIIAAFTTYFLTKRFLEQTLINVISYKQPQWRPVLEHERTFRQLTYVAPILFVYLGTQYFPGIGPYIHRFLNGYLIINMTLFLGTILSTVLEIYNQYPVSHAKPIKSYIQLLKIFIYIVGTISAVCALLDKDPSVFIGSIGVMTTVLIVVFKDTILSFIAGMQIAANNLIQRGDWIEVANFGADGHVVDVALHVIRIQNFDKTIVTIPTYKVLESSFKNWRGMYDAGVRRIMQSLYIDQTTVRFLTEQEMTELFQDKMVLKYLPMPTYDEELTNLRLFRRWVEGYLANNKNIDTQNSVLARLLEPTVSGIPLQIYVFSKETARMGYENVQGSIFEVLIAVLSKFHLRVFQNPNGSNAPLQNLENQDEIIPLKKDAL